MPKKPKRKKPINKITPVAVNQYIKFGIVSNNEDIILDSNNKVFSIRVIDGNHNQSIIDYLSKNTNIGLEAITQIEQITTQLNVCNSCDSVYSIAIVATSMNTNDIKILNTKPSIIKTLDMYNMSMKSVFLDGIFKDVDTMLFVTCIGSIIGAIV